MKVALHFFVVDFAAGAEVRLCVGEEIVRAKVDDVISANVRVCPFELSRVGVAFEEVSVPAHQLVQH